MGSHSFDNNDVNNRIKIQHVDMINKNIIKDSIKREDDRFNNIEGFNDAMWLEVSVSGVKTEAGDTDDVTTAANSHNYDVIVDVKTEMSADNVIVKKAINKDCDMTMSNDVVGNDMDHAETIGEDNDRDISLLLREEVDKETSTQVELVPSNSQNMLLKHLQRGPGGLEDDVSCRDEQGVTGNCDKCNNDITDPRHVECLIIVQSGEKPYMCSVCKAKFKYRNKLILHFKKHTGEKQYSCGVCKKDFQNKNAVGRHERIHSVEKQCKCDICPKVFFKRDNLKQHSSTHSVKLSHPCEVCKRKFTCSSGLQRHMVTHTADKPYSCYVCGKRFNANCNLQKHLKLHSEEKPYTCDMCKKTFCESAHFQSHLRTHSGEKPYCCDICGKGFTIKSALPRHLKIHTDFKPYFCNVCNKTFNENYNLQRHMRVHSGEKPFSCNVCKKMFSDKGNLLKHVRQFHKK